MTKQQKQEQYRLSTGQLVQIIIGFAVIVLSYLVHIEINVTDDKARILLFLFGAGALLLGLVHLMINSRGGLYYAVMLIAVVLMYFSSSVWLMWIWGWSDPIGVALTSVGGILVISALLLAKVAKV